MIGRVGKIACACGATCSDQTGDLAHAAAYRGADSGRVEEGRGCLSLWQSLRFPSPLIEPDVRISRIRLSDQLHLKAHGGGVLVSWRSRTTPNLPKMISSENRPVPSDGTL